MEKASRRLTSRTALAILIAILLAASGLLASGAQEAEAAALKAPAKVKIASVKSNAVGKVTVKVKKAKRAKGYQYKISQKKNFKGKTTITAKAKKASKTFSGLKGGKTYYVKVRAYAKSGKKVKYGKWSAVKAVKVKKKASGGSSSSTSASSSSSSSSSGGSSSSSSSSSGSDNPDDVEVTAVELDKAVAEIEEGETVTLTASVVPADATNAEIAWSTSDESIATVDGGVVTGTGAGLAVITATAASGASADCEVYVSMAGTAEHERFAQEAFALMQSADVELNPALAEADPYFLHRLLLKDDGTQLNFEADYGAMGSVRDADGFNVVQFDSSEAAEQALRSLQENEHVIWVEADSCSQATAESGSETAQDSTFHPWGVTRIGADVYAESLVQMGKKEAVIVAVVDSGITAEHPLFENRIARGGWDFVNNDDDPADDNRLDYDDNGKDIVTNTYHGTHVSGTVVDCTPGLNVKILPIKVADDHAGVTFYRTAKGIERAVDKGAKVINLSLMFYSHSNTIDDAIEDALDHGVTVVVAAGNLNCDTADRCPAHLSEVIVVGAVDDKDERWAYSNYGSSVDVVAPGVDIQSAAPVGNGYQMHSGTSMATPHIAAAAAMIKLRNPDYSPAEIENALKECASDLGPSGRDDKYGYGLPDLRNLKIIVDSGTWGTCPWTLYDNGTLAIGGGTGEDTGGQNPWSKYSGSIEKVVVGADSGTVVFPEDSSGLFAKLGTVQEITFENVDTSNATDMGSMFFGCESLTSLDLSGLDTKNVTDMRNMFASCPSLKSLDLSPLDTSNVTDMSDMFSYCTSLTSLDLSPLDTSSVTDMGSMFCDCSSLTSLDLSPLDTSNATSMGNMFGGCFSLTSLDLSPLDTSNVTHMNHMFFRCESLTSLDLSGLDTSKATDMSYMFCDCRSLTSLDLSPLDTENVTNMEWMFDQCRSLTSLDLSPLNTENVTDMDGMFRECYKLRSLDLSPLDTKNVTDMGGMFGECYSLRSLDLSGLDTSSVTDMCFMFGSCGCLTTLDLSPLDTSSVTDMSGMFEYCEYLSSLITGEGWNYNSIDASDSTYFHFPQFPRDMLDGSGTGYAAGDVIPEGAHTYTAT